MKKKAASSASKVTAKKKPAAKKKAPAPKKPSAPVVARPSPRADHDSLVDARAGAESAAPRRHGPPLEPDASASHHVTRCGPRSRPGQGGRLAHPFLLEPSHAQSQSQASTAKPHYDVHPGVAMMRNWADEFPAKTGRTLDQWAKFINNTGIDGRQDRIAFLKDEHGIGTNSAWYIVDYAADSHSWDGEPDVYLAQAEKYVEEQYAGPKATLRPIFDAVLVEVRKLGSDVKVCPCKTIVPFYRNRVFAELKPAARTRVRALLSRCRAFHSAGCSRRIRGPTRRID